MSQPPPRLYVAGSSSAIPRPGRASSGYLLQTGGASIVFDMGSGAFSHLRSEVDCLALDAVVISHMHADHFIDLIQLRYALRYEVQRSSRLPVFMPPDGIRILNHMAQPLKETPEFFGDVFDMTEYVPDGHVRIGDTTISFAPTIHYVPAYALRFDTPAGTLAYSADTAMCDAVVNHARGADVFLCESSLGADGVESGPGRGHSNAVEAGTMAARAGVKHLVLTHYGKTVDPISLGAAARGVYDGPVTVADDGLDVPLVQALFNEHV